MIQRVQSIYLILAFICMTLLLFFPIFSVEMETLTGDMSFTAVVGKDGVIGDGFEAGKFPLSNVFISLALLTVVTILLYKKRPRQLLMCRLNLILHFLLVVVIYAFYFFGKPFIQERIQSSIGEDVTVNFHMQLGFFFLIPTLAFLFLAVRGIKKDELLIKSLDRIR